MWLVSHMIIRCRHTVEIKERERKRDNSTTTTLIWCLCLCLSVLYFVYLFICLSVICVCTCTCVWACVVLCCLVKTRQMVNLGEPLVEAPSGADVQTVEKTSTKGRKTHCIAYSLQSFLRGSRRWTGLSGNANYQRKISERVVVPTLKHSMGRWTSGARENPHSLSLFFFLSRPPPSPSSSSRSHASVCAFKTSPCVQETRPHAFSVPHHNTQQHSTAQNTPHRSKEKRRRDEREEKRRREENREETEMKREIKVKRDLFNWVVCLKILIRSTERWKLGIRSPSNSPRAHWHHIKIRERKSIARRHSNVWTSRAQSVRSQIWGKDTIRNFAPRKMRPWSGMGLGEKLSTSWKIRIKERLTLLWKSVQCRRPQKFAEEREIVVDSGAPLHMLSRKDPSSGDLETLRRSRIPTQRW